MNDEKKFVQPTAEVLEFEKEDIITVSQGDTADWTGEEFQ